MPIKRDGLICENGNDFQICSRKLYVINRNYIQNFVLNFS